MSDPKFNNQAYLKTLSDLAENVYADSVCCGIPLLGMRSVVEHVEEYHSQPQTGNSELDSLYGFTFPSEINYETCENSALDNSIPDITFEECCSQLRENFIKYGKTDQETLMDHSLDNTSTNFPTPISHSFISQNVGADSNHYTNLKSVGVTSPKPITGACSQLSARVKSDPPSNFFACPNAGCKKTYKNHNGLKYHMIQGRCSVHMVDYAQDKPFRCQHPNCFHAYKNANGLKYHEEQVHQISNHRDKKAEGNRATNSEASLASSSTANASVHLPSKRTIDPSNLIMSLRGLHPDFLALLLENPPPPFLTSNVTKRSMKPKSSFYPFSKIGI